MSESSDITIKILTEGLPQELKFFLYTLLWTISSINLWIYVKILNNTKDLFTRRRHHHNHHNYNQLLPEVNEGNDN